MIRKAFTLDRCSVVPPTVRAGNWIAYFTEIGGSGKGRWLRALVVRVVGGPRILALDEEGDVVSLERWERVFSPPKLKPDILRDWLRTMAVYPAEGGALA